jgi:hypothetical protein
MPIGPMDEFHAHQTCESFDHVFTSDRHFYDRYYFNMHPLGDELFLVFGMGQYPNLGTMDAFVAISKGDDMHVLRSSRELGSDRMSTQVGPLSVEILEGMKKLRIEAAPNEWGIHCDLVFDATVPVVEEPRTIQRAPHGRITTDTSRYSQAGRWSGSLEVDGDRYEVRPEEWIGVRDHSWGIRGVGDPEPPGIRVKSLAEGFGFFHTWIPLQLDDYLLKIFKEEDQHGNPIVEESVKIHSLAKGGKVEEMGSPRFAYQYQPGTREIASAVIEVEDPQGKLLRLEATPLRTVYLAAGSGYVPNGGWGHGMYQGALKVEGVKTFVGTPEARAPLGPIYETLCRFELSDGQVGYGMLENLVVGVYEPFGFMSPSDVG